MTGNDSAALRQAERRERRKISEYLAELHRQGFLAVVGKRRGRRLYQCRPGAAEWFEAVEGYTVTRDSGTVTEAHREKVRETWLAIRNRVELDSDQLALMDEVMRPPP